MLVGTIFSACVGPLVAFSQCGIAYCNVLVMKNIENKIMNYEILSLSYKDLRSQPLSMCENN